MILLQDLPREVLLNILEKLDPSDICRLGSTCKYLQDLTMDEFLWTKIILKEFALKVQSDQMFSPKHFYRTVLHPYKSTIGVWKQTDSGYYGGLLKVSAHSDSIQFEKFKTPDSIEKNLMKEDVLKIYYQHGSNEPFIEVQNTQDSAEVIVTDDEGLKINLTTAGSNSNMNKYEKLEIIPNRSRLPICEGIYLGSFGPYGLKLIHLSLPQSRQFVGVQGIKITGGSNVPADEVTFRVTDDKCLDMTIEEQNSMANINRFATNPRYIDFNEDSLLDFVPPNDAFDMYGDIIPFTKCLGRWNCECQIASHGHQNPEFIPGHLIVFSQEYFAVLFNISNTYYNTDIAGFIILYKNVTKQVCE